jgi:hypothetical protein
VKKRVPQKGFLIACMTMTAISLGLFLLICVFRLFGFELLYTWISMAMLFSVTIFGCATFILHSMRRGAKKSVYIASAILFALIICMLIVTTLVEATFSDVPVAYDSSPDAKHSIVVLEGGFIDASYSSFPVAFGIFYHQNNNSSALRHDFWGGATFDVVWNQDSAVVYVLFDENGRNETDKLVVPFT